MEVGAVHPNRPRAIEVNRPYLGSIGHSIYRDRAPCLQGEQRKHAAGPPFLGAIRIIMLKITGGADAAIVNFFDTGIAALPDNFRGEINLVMRRPNARAQLRNQITGSNSKLLTHRRDRVPNDSQGSSFLARMNQTNRPGISVNQIDRAAIGHIDSEADIALVRNQSITAFKTFVTGGHKIDHRDLIAMDLACRDKFSPTQSQHTSRFAMNLIEVRDHNIFVV